VPQVCCPFTMLLPFQGEYRTCYIPRAMPWAMCLLVFQTALRFGEVEFYMVAFFC